MTTKISILDILFRIAYEYVLRTKYKDIRFFIFFFRV